MKIFIIDDDPIYCLIVSRTINMIDASLIIDQSENGAIGLAKLEHLSNETDKIIVLLDINMPILDGWGFLDKIQKYNFYNLPQLIIYIVSSSTDESDILRANQFGFVKGFFHKPLSKEDINSIIDLD